jgi:hypothetical protein
VRRRQPTTWTASGGITVAAAYWWIAALYVGILDLIIWLVTR